MKIKDHTYITFLISIIFKFSSDITFLNNTLKLLVGHKVVLETNESVVLTKVWG